MTKTEEKAQDKATELTDLFVNLVYPYSGSGFMTDTIDQEVVLINCKKCAINVCNETIKALSNVKGMGKIHKVSFWKKVKSNLEK